MAKCSSCGRFLSQTSAVACVYCPGKYHKSCVALPDYVTPPKDWICLECTKKQRKGDKSTSKTADCGAVESSPSAGDNTSLIATPPIDSDVPALRQELAQYMSEQREFREELRASLLSMGLRIDGLEKRIVALERKESSSDKDNHVSVLQKTIAQLKQELNDRDQEALQTDLEIGQVPEEKGENILHIVTVVAAKLGVTLQDRDIVFAERIGAAVISTGVGSGEERGGRARRVIVRLARRDLRDQLLRAARVRRNLNSTDMGIAGPPRRVYVNERLTKHNRVLFYKARSECTKKQWRYAWSKRGRVYVRQGEGHQVHLIRSDADLERVFGAISV